MTYIIETQNGLLIGEFLYCYGLAEERTALIENARVNIIGFEKGYIHSQAHTYFSKGHVNMQVHIVSQGGHNLYTEYMDDSFHLDMFGQSSKHVDELLLACESVILQPGHIYRTLHNWAETKNITVNQWVTLPVSEKRNWLASLSVMHSTYQRNIQPNMTYDMDAQHITDYPSFFLTLGETINGPRGYFGRDLDALSDCLCGGFGATSPFTLNMYHHSIAQRSLTNTAWRQQRLAMTSGSNLDDFLTQFDGPSLWQAIMQTLEEGGVHVNLL